MELLPIALAASPLTKGRNMAHQLHVRQQALVGVEQFALVGAGEAGELHQQYHRQSDALNLKSSPSLQSRVTLFARPNQLAAGLQGSLLAMTNSFGVITS
jgi:hypothetical protein